MAFRIGEVITAGEIINTSRNSICGWLNFDDGETGIRLDLAGNLQGELAGQHLRFEVTPQPLPDTDLAELRQSVKKLQVMQIGVMGDSCLRIVKVPRCSIKEFIEADPENRPPCDEKPCLYLEWFSQNGRMVAEILEPQIAYGPDDAEEEKVIEPEPLPDYEPGIEAVGFEQNEDGEYERIEIEPTDPSDDPYKLFPTDLDEKLQTSQEPTEFEDPEPDWEAERTPEPKRNWADVPGVDPETAKMYEEWDEILHEDAKHEPVTQLFDPPMMLKPPASVQDEAEATEILKQLLARLAQHSVAIDICEHFTSVRTYRWLIEEILPTARIHPRAGASGFVCHYSTWEFCETCDAEFEAEYQVREKEKREREKRERDGEDT